MALLKKDVMNKYIEEHGLDVSGMQWAKANYYVQEEAKKEGLINVDGFLVSENESDDVVNTPVPEPVEDYPAENKLIEDYPAENVDDQTKQFKDMEAHIKELEAEVSRLKERKRETQNLAPANETNDVVIEDGKIYDLPDEEITIKPGLKFMRHQLIKVDEPIGDDIEVEEVSMLDNLGHFNEGQTNRTFKMKGKTGKKTVAQSTLPKEQVKITFNYARDIVPVVHSNDGVNSGYLWAHHSLPNIKELLVASNSYNEYKSYFSDATHPENVFYCGNLIAVRKDVVHEIFHEIEMKHAARR